MVPPVSPPDVGLRQQVTNVLRVPASRLGFWIHWMCSFWVMTFTLMWGYPFLMSGLGYPQPVAAQRVDVGGAVSWAISKFGQNWQVLLVFAAVIMVIQLINNRLSGVFDSSDFESTTDAADTIALLGLSLVGLLVTIALSLVALIAEFGLINASLKITRGEKANYSDFWDSRTGVAFVVVAILFGLAVGFGLVFCIIPGLLALWAWQFLTFISEASFAAIY